MVVNLVIEGYDQFLYSFKKTASKELSVVRVVSLTEKEYGFAVHFLKDQ